MPNVPWAQFRRVVGILLFNPLCKLRHILGGNQGWEDVGISKTPVSFDRFILPSSASGTPMIHIVGPDARPFPCS
jgi:hypothetical protein